MMELRQVESGTKFYEGGEVRRFDRFEIGGYTVNKLTVMNNAEGKVEYTSISVCPDMEERYLPEIRYEDGFWTTEKPKFTIQTTAYGALDSAEIHKVVAGYQQALQVVEVLTKNFC